MTMARLSNMITFSLAASYLEKLQSFANPEESLGLAAKRLLISLLDEGVVSSAAEEILARLEELSRKIDNKDSTTIDNYSNDTTNSIDNSVVETILERLSVLEEKASNQPNPARLDALEARLIREVQTFRSALETLPAAASDSGIVERLEAVEERIQILNATVKSIPEPYQVEARLEANAKIRISEGLGEIEHTQSLMFDEWEERIRAVEANLLQLEGFSTEPQAEPKKRGRPPKA